MLGDRHAGARDDEGAQVETLTEPEPSPPVPTTSTASGGRLDPQHLAAHRRHRAGDFVDGFAAHAQRHQEPAHLRGRGLAGHHAVEGGGRFFTRQRRAGGDFSDDRFEVVHRVPSGVGVCSKYHRGQFRFVPPIMLSC